MTSPRMGSGRGQYGAATAYVESQNVDLRLLEAVLWERQGIREGADVRFLCPSHDDHHPSARWNPEKRVWCCDTCQAGGGYTDLAKRLGVDLSNGSPPKPKPAPRPTVATYDYEDTDGTLLFQVERLEPKGFRQRRPNDKGGWVYNLEGVTPVLYRLPQVLAQVGKGGAVYVVEGEKDVHSLEVLGKVATCNAMGALKWRDDYSETLKGAHVVLLPDNDPTGVKHMLEVALSIRGVRSLRIAMLPDLPPKGDVSDWLATGRTTEDLDAVLRAAPQWTPEGDVSLEVFAQGVLGTPDVVLKEQPWPPLAPLPDLAPDPPDLPAEMLPEPLRSWILDAAKRACVHVAFIGMVTMCSLGAVLGRSLAVRPKARDDWQEVANLWCAIVAPPSSLKSLAITEGTAHIRRLAAKAIEEHQTRKRTSAAQTEVLKLELEQLKKTARGKNAKPSDFQADIQTKLAEIDALEGETERRYIVNDATVEKVGELLLHNPRGLLYLRDEVVGLLQQCDRPGYEHYRPFLLEAWNAKGSYTFDRISRGTLHIPALCLSVCGGIQPGRLRSYISGAMANSAEADGLLQRFQLLVWFDKPRQWEYVDEHPDKRARDRVFKLFEFFDLNVGALAQVFADADDSSDLPALGFGDDAQELYRAWLDALMTRLRGEEFAHTPAFQAHLAKYPSLVPSLALIFHLVTLADANAMALTPITFDATALAVTWAEYLELHARKLYATELDTPLASAHTLAGKVTTGEVMDGQKVSDIYRHKWPGLTQATEVEAALKVLTEVGWVRVEEVRNEGARPSQILRIHPGLRGAA